MDYKTPTDPEALSAFTEDLRKQYPNLAHEIIGHSILGRPIEMLSLGNGESCSLFVGAHHGAESITSLLLMKFAEDILKNERTPSHRLIGFDLKQILKHRSLYIVPMLNPDGVAIRHFGADAADLFKKRVIAMNGNHNFSLWQANARGVDLNHNYDAEFEQCKKAERALGIISGGPTRYGGDYPESEPESRALVHLTRILSPTLKTVLALHTQGEEIYWDFAGDAPKNARMLAECFSRVSGYTVASPPAEASYGGYKDFVIREFGIPAFTIECGRGKNPLPSSDFYAIYDRVLPILLTAAAF
jgi:g-D-glutamyl-meso-diaminopimelate peptidase